MSSDGQAIAAAIWNERPEMRALPWSEVWPRMRPVAVGDDAAVKAAQRALVEMDVVAHATWGELRRAAPETAG